MNSQKQSSNKLNLEKQEKSDNPLLSVKTAEPKTQNRTFTLNENEENNKTNGED